MWYGLAMTTTNASNLHLSAWLINIACDRQDQAGAFSAANPSTPLRDNPHVRGADVALRHAFRTRNVVWSCQSCGSCFCRVVGEAPEPITSACCGADLTIDAPKKNIANLLRVDAQV